LVYAVHDANRSLRVSNLFARYQPPGVYFVEEAPLSGTVEIRNPTLRSQKRGQNISNYKREIPHPHVDLDLAEVKPSSLGHVNDCIYDKLLDATLSLCRRALRTRTGDVLECRRAILD